MIARLEQLLKTLIGLDARTLGQGAIERALRQRLAACALDEEAYWALASASPAEQRALIEAVVVPETWFFRYPESFVLLATQARALQGRRPAGQPLRLLSLPCSTGEEPYSIAMALLDAGFAPHGVHIDALDISQRALDHAARGRYSGNAFRGDALDFRERHFQREADGTHRIHERLRGMVNWQAGNLLDAAVLSARAPYDLVFCRNLLIYFDRPTQLQALAQLERVLLADGLLFVGPAEAGLLTQRGLQALDTAHSFAFRRRAAPQTPAARPSAAPATPRPAPLRTPPPAAAAMRPVPPPQATPPAAPADTATGLARIAALANAGRHTEALSACAEQLDRHGPSAELYFWWGLLCDGAGQTDAAQRHYRKALYLEPHHAQALAHLAALLAAHGDRSGAARLQQRLKQQGTHDVGSKS
ncbi:chemotaxis protein methyltransferase WspC [Acidovorax soli]|uniref:Chemotaxis protein methyltransferase WspC n=1 Tax=Acidovorax soli TaxID=592050 RepID=A0A7X0UBQ7_9BURK|nr:protein-glutamate O-methyltransferase CheR [Acidovorax soli]MBB6562229.1 chemotaxis protein methyltransferase WspC [Acidovorax soli]